MNGYLLQAVSARSVHQEYNCAAFEVSAFIMNSTPKSEKPFNLLKGGKSTDHHKHLAFALRTSAVTKLSDEHKCTTYYHRKPKDCHNLWNTFTMKNIRGKKSLTIFIFPLRASNGGRRCKEKRCE